MNNTDRLVSIENIKIELRNQIKVREKLISEMIGTLYKQVLYDEIAKIHKMLISVG